MSVAFKPLRAALSVAAFLTMSGIPATAQEPNPTAVAPGAKSAQVIAEGPNGTYIYHVKVVQR